MLVNKIEKRLNRHVHSHSKKTVTVKPRVFARTPQGRTPSESPQLPSRAFSFSPEYSQPALIMMITWGIH